MNFQKARGTCTSSLSPGFTSPLPPRYIQQGQEFLEGQMLGEGFFREWENGELSALCSFSFPGLVALLV